MRYTLTCTQKLINKLTVRQKKIGWSYLWRRQETYSEVKEKWLKCTGRKGVYDDCPNRTLNRQSMSASVCLRQVN